MKVSLSLGAQLRRQRAGVRSERPLPSGGRDRPRRPVSARKGPVPSYASSPALTCNYPKWSEIDGLRTPPAHLLHASAPLSVPAGRRQRRAARRRNTPPPSVRDVRDAARRLATRGVHQFSTTQLRGELVHAGCAWSRETVREVLKGGASSAGGALHRVRADRYRLRDQRTTATAVGAVGAVDVYVLAAMRRLAEKGALRVTRADVHDELRAVCAQRPSQPPRRRRR